MINNLFKKSFVMLAFLTGLALAECPTENIAFEFAKFEDYQPITIRKKIRFNSPLLDKTLSYGLDSIAAELGTEKTYSIADKKLFKKEVYE